MPRSTSPTLRYFYFVWVHLETGLYGGSGMLAFTKYFDLAVAHTVIFKEYGEVGMVTSWREICEANFNKFNRWVAVHDSGGGDDRGPKPRRHLRLVPPDDSGGGDDPPPAA